MNAEIAYRTIELPTPELIDIPLTPRPVLQASWASRLEGRVYLGRPYWCAVQPDTESSIEGRTYRRVDENSAISYYFLSIPANFAPAAEPIIDAALGVALECGGGQSSIRPVVRALSPIRLDQPMTRTTTIGISANMGIISSQLQHGRTSNNPTALLQATGLGASRCTWSFRRTAKHNLEGPFDLSMIIEAGSDSTVVAILALSASVRISRLGVIQFNAEVPEDMTVVRLV